MMYNANFGIGSRSFYPTHHMWSDGGWFSPYAHAGFFGYGAWIVAGLLALAAIAVLVAALVSHKKQKESVALEPLKQRFIKGEITEEEYLSMKKVVLKK